LKPLKAGMKLTTALCMRTLKSAFKSSWSFWSGMNASLVMDKISACGCTNLNLLSLFVE
jgi:hypothetical protein